MAVVVVVVVAAVTLLLLALRDKRPGLVDLESLRARLSLLARRAARSRAASASRRPAAADFVRVPTSASSCFLLLLRLCDKLRLLLLPDLSPAPRRTAPLLRCFFSAAMPWAVATLWPLLLVLLPLLLLLPL